jgi:hypothetical protein
MPAAPLGSGLDADQGILPTETQKAALRLL